MTLEVLASERDVFPEDGSLLAYLTASLAPHELEELLANLSDEDVAMIERERFDWPLWARPEQLAPAGDWRVWAMQAGRGGGKTRGGAEWVVQGAQRYSGIRIGLMGPTAAKARDIMIEDVESGLLAVSPPWFFPKYEPSKKRITWPNGSRGIIYSADEPDQSRGANLHRAWADEVGEWDDAESWQNLDMALRKAKQGVRPQICVTTTPRPTELIREIFQPPKMEDGRRPPISWSILRPATAMLPAAHIAWPRQDTVVTRWGTDANRANLADDFLRRMRERYAGTRLGRQELDAEILDDTPGALWNLSVIDKHRIEKHPRLARLIVSVDPSHANDGGNDACGIVVVGIGGDKNHGYVLADRSLNASPNEWGYRILETYDEFRADAIVYEDNGSPGRPDVVENVIRAVDPRGRVRWVGIHASRDKRTRADPVSALYEQGRVHHVAEGGERTKLAALEDEMVSWDPTSRHSPNRLDALVHGLTHLMLGGTSAPVAPISMGTRKSPWKV